MKVVNLTAHSINVILGEKELAYPSEGLARVRTEEKTIGTVEGIPVIKTVYTTVEGLPEQQENTIYLVSTLVLQALKTNGIDRPDCLAPNTGISGAIRDEQGCIIGVKGVQTI